MNKMYLQISITLFGVVSSIVIFTYIESTVVKVLLLIALFFYLHSWLISNDASNNGLKNINRQHKNMCIFDKSCSNKFTSKNNDTHTDNKICVVDRNGKKRFIAPNCSYVLNNKIQSDHIALNQDVINRVVDKTIEKLHPEAANSENNCSDCADDRETSTNTNGMSKDVQSIVTLVTNNLLEEIANEVYTNSSDNTSSSDHETSSTDNDTSSTDDDASSTHGETSSDDDKQGYDLQRDQSVVEDHNTDDNKQSTSENDTDDVKQSLTSIVENDTDDVKQSLTSIVENDTDDDDDTDEI